jgi:hypothetical protein
MVFSTVEGEIFIGLENANLKLASEAKAVSHYDDEPKAFRLATR